MKMNVQGPERALRLLIGGLILAWAFAGGPWWAYLGVFLIATASWKYCPVRAALSNARK